MECSSAGAAGSKCALVHVASEQLALAKDIRKPLWHVDEVMKGCKDNHYETLQSMYAASIYQPWVHSFKACVFHLMPPDMDGDHTDDVCVAMAGTRRMIKHDPL